LFGFLGKHPRVVGSFLYESWQLWMARPICLRLFSLWVRAAASRTFWTAGTNKPIKMAMMAMTTSNSISVKARRRRQDGRDRGIKARLDEESDRVYRESARIH